MKPAHLKISLKLKLTIQELNKYFKSSFMRKRSAFSALFLIFALLISVGAQDKAQKIDELVQKYYELGQINESKQRKREENNKET
jgi:hypothetical protein